jgi:RND superfamily putative drug exporter
MHEEYLNTGDNEEAIIRGQANTGRVITAAALVMICVFLSFAVGGERIIAEFGIGLGGAVYSSTRSSFARSWCPHSCTSSARRNWFMPRWLDRIVPHVAVEATE